MKSDKIHLTKSELEIIRILWDSGPSTVRKVHEQIVLGRKVGYTTTLKTMQQMNEKNFILKDTSAVAHVFTSNVDRTQIQSSMLKDLLEKVYSNQPKKMILQVLGNHKITEDEINDIEDFIKQMKENK